jgi:transposase InsO family protein
LPKVGNEVVAKRKFKVYPIGYFHIDIAEVRTAEGKLYLFVAIDRTSKFAFVEVHEKAATRIAANFLIALVKSVPYKIHTVLTDNGTHFTDPSGETWTPTEIKEMLAQGRPFRAHAAELRVHLAHFVTAYNFARWLKTLKGRTPYEFICKLWTKEPNRFRLDPLHQMLGLNI